MIADEKLKLKINCPICEKVSEIAEFNFFELEFFWWDLVTMKHNNKCECGAGMERKFIIEGFKSVDRYFMECRRQLREQFSRHIVKRGCNIHPNSFGAHRTKGNDKIRVCKMPNVISPRSLEYKALTIHEKINRKGKMYMYWPAFGGRYLKIV